MLACMSNLHQWLLWCAAVSPSPSMHEQLKDFLPGSIILNCEPDRLWQAAPSPTEFTGRRENVSPYAGAVTLAMSNELWGWLSNSFRCSRDSASKISACRLKPGARAEFTLRQFAFTPTTALRKTNLEESSFFHGWSKKGKQAMSQSLKCHLFSISISALKYLNHGETSKTHAACRHSSKHIWALAHMQTHPHTPLDICLWLRWWYTTYGAREPPNPLAESAEESIGSVCVWAAHTLRIFRFRLLGSGWQANGLFQKFN